MNIKFYVPSYRRPEKSITQTKYPFVKLVVAESDELDYKWNGNDIVVVPDSAQGNICRIKNYILDNFFDDDVDCIIFMDDDCRGVYKWSEDLKKVLLTPLELYEVSQKLTLLCDEWGFKFWGLSPIPDKGIAREGTPFNTLNFIGSPFHAHLRGCEVRYDEEFSLKEDYDITLEHIRRWSGCLRVNWLCYDVKQGVSGSGQKGGCAQYRNGQRELEQLRGLQRKWGTKAVRIDSGSKRSIDTNPIIKAPLRGV
jgi:hypothetical protein